MFDRAVSTRAKGAVRPHMMLDHHGYLPRYVALTKGKGSEITVAEPMSFQARLLWSGRVARGPKGSSIVRDGLHETASPEITTGRRRQPRRDRRIHGRGRRSGCSGGCRRYCVG